MTNKIFFTRFQVVLLLLTNEKLILQNGWKSIRHRGAPKYYYPAKEKSLGWKEKSYAWTTLVDRRQSKRFVYRKNRVFSDNSLINTFIDPIKSITIYNWTVKMLILLNYTNLLIADYLILSAWHTRQKQLKSLI
jgi:hypothetical protein